MRTGERSVAQAPRRRNLDLNIPPQVLHQEGRCQRKRCPGRRLRIESNSRTLTLAATHPSRALQFTVVSRRLVGLDPIVKCRLPVVVLDWEISRGSAVVSRDSYGLAGKPKASRGSKKHRRQNASSDSVPAFHWRRAGTVAAIMPPSSESKITTTPTTPT